MTGYIIPSFPTNSKKQALAAGLKENRSITEIDFGCNQLGDAEVQAPIKEAGFRFRV